VELLDAKTLGALIDANATTTLFRLETLDRYDVASDGVDYERFLAGEAEPTWSRKQPWLDRLRLDKEQGLYTHRVHVLTTPLTDYLRYECAWGYAYNQAYEDIRILDLATTPRPNGLIDEDFWLIDDRLVAVMHYDEGGRYLGATEASAAEVPRYRAARDASWAAAVPFSVWWAAHPEYHQPRAA
jgi:hypothetical protein